MAYTRKTMTKEIAEQLIEQYGKAIDAARAIVNDCVNADGGRPSIDAVRHWLQDAVNGNITGPKAILEAEDATKLNRLKELLDAANIPIEAIGKIDKAKFKAWGVHAKVKKRDENGKVIGEEIVKDGLWSTELALSPTWEDGPKWPLFHPADPVVINWTPPTVFVPRKMRIEVVSPDKQIGYRREIETRHFDGVRESFEMTPMHDPNAIDVSEQIVATVRPDGYTDLGDIMDFSEFSKYRQVEEFFRTTQPAIDYAYMHLSRIAAIMTEPGKPKKPRLRMVDGNHDNRRISTYIQDNARAAYGLRPGGESPKSWPQLTLGSLLKLDELGFEQSMMWPGSRVWLIEGSHALVVTHNPTKLGHYQGNVISGHTHHRRETAYTVLTPYGQQRFSHHEIGCLCSLEQVQYKTSIVSTGVPSDRGYVKDWVHGLAIVEIFEDTGQHKVDFVPIYDGVAFYQGQKFTATGLKKVAKK